MATVKPLRYVAFLDLAFSEQLFLWAVRQLVFSEEMNRPLPSALVRTYAAVGLPQGVSLIWRVLRQFSAGARRAVLVNVPSATYLLDDELVLIECLRAQSNASAGCPRQALRALIVPERVARLLAEFALVYHHLSAIEVLHGCQQPTSAEGRRAGYRQIGSQPARLVH